MMRISKSGVLRASLTQTTRQATSTSIVSRAAAASTAAASPPTTTSSSYPLSNPTLANIEKRWEGMPLQEQAELWMALRDRMKENWQDLTLQEKKAGESRLKVTRPVLVDRKVCWKSSSMSSTHPNGLPSQHPVRQSPCTVNYESCVAFISHQLTYTQPTAYWIAFGPHGPRALPPPGEGKKVAFGVLVGLLASAVIFGTSRMFAKPPPHTMNKEWQEAANEYLKVRDIHFSCGQACYNANCSLCRSKKPTPSPVSALPITRARDRFNLHLLKQMHCRSAVNTGTQVFLLLWH